MELRQYQIDLATKTVELLKGRGIAYLAFEMRTGKTLTSLTAANMYGAKRVLFVTKKKAISSIESDYKAFNFNFAITVTNYEQVGNLRGEYDFIIIDEAHSLGAFPKPSQRTEQIKKIVGAKPLILLSGTPNPESFSQMYHQLWISDNSPFNGFKNFYKWAKEYVDVKERIFNGVRINDYSRAKKDKIKLFTDPIMLTHTQAEAGFTENIIETVKTVQMQPITYEMTRALVNERYYKFPTGKEVIADTPVKLQTKIHQLFSGTVIDDNGEASIQDYSKTNYIKENYGGKKIAIFYKYIAEGRLLRDTLQNTTDNPELFNSSVNLTFISQIRSGAMGINLSTADLIIMYNIDFSSVLYWQARARLSDKNRTKPCEVHWLFAENGIEQKIYDTVLKKRNYTTYYFNKDFKVKNERVGITSQDTGGFKEARAFCG